MRLNRYISPIALSFLAMSVAFSTPASLSLAHTFEKEDLQFVADDDNAPVPLGPKTGASSRAGSAGSKSATAPSAPQKGMKSAGKAPNNASGAKAGSATTMKPPAAKKADMSPTGVIGIDVIGLTIDGAMASFADSSAQKNVNDDDLRMLFSLNLRNGLYKKWLRCLRTWQFQESEANLAQDTFKKLSAKTQEKTVFDDPNLKSKKEKVVPLIYSAKTQPLFQINEKEWSLQQNVKTKAWIILQPRGDNLCFLDASEPLFQRIKPQLKEEFDRLQFIVYFQSLRSTLSQSFGKNGSEFDKIFKNQSTPGGPSAPLMFYHVDDLSNALPVMQAAGGVSPGFLKHIMQQVNAKTVMINGQILSFSDPIYGTYWYKFKRGQEESKKQ